MVFGGVDVGSLSADAVIMENGEIVAYSVLPTGGDSTAAAYLAMEAALKKTALTLKDFTYTVATGYGRVNVPFAQENVTEIDVMPVVPTGFFLRRGRSWIWEDRTARPSDVMSREESPTSP